MSHELSEHIEHAAHKTGRQAPLGRWIGITMALLGVLMAVCAALVGAARTELIATMVEETGASLRYQSVSSKYRMLQAQLQQLHALMPDPKMMAATEAELHRLEAGMKDPEAAKTVKVIRLETSKVLNTVTPTHQDLLRFVQLIRRYHKETEVAKEWAESYEGAIKVHTLSASRFEMGQLAAEIGIVIASVALLLTNRWLWITAVALAAITLFIVVGTYTVNHQTLHGAEEKIAETRKHFFALSNEEAEMVEDEKLIHDIEKEAKGHPDVEKEAKEHDAKTKAKGH